MKKAFFLLLLALFSLALTRAEDDLYNPLAVGLRWEVTVDLTAHRLNQNKMIESVK